MQLAAAVLGNLKIEIFNEIPIKEMRANSLTELDLNGKYVGVEGGMVIAGLIPVMGGLTSLDLSSNQLCGVDCYGRGTYSAEGITAIADALRINGALTKLLLAQNFLKEAGTKAICEALEQNTTLKELDISGGDRSSNTGGSAGAKHVAEMVRVNGALTSINLSDNHLTDGGRDMSGIKELAAALGVNGGLTECNLRLNYNMGEAGEASIRIAVQGKASFKLHL